MKWLIRSKKERNRSIGRDRGRDKRKEMKMSLKNTKNLNKNLEINISQERKSRNSDNYNNKLFVINLLYFCLNFNMTFECILCAE